MPALIQGRVVYSKIAIPDPQGHNPKEGRPFVVVSTDEDIKQGGSIFACGITGTFDDSQTDLYVILPHGPTAKSGLRKASAALCTWVIDISPEKLDIGPGYVHPRLSMRLRTRLRSWGRSLRSFGKIRNNVYSGIVRPAELCFCPIFADDEEDAQPWQDAGVAIVTTGKLP